MEWPAQSPDLNPIELLWEQLDRMVHKVKAVLGNFFIKTKLKFKLKYDWQIFHTTHSVNFTPQSLF